MAPSAWARPGPGSSSPAGRSSHRCAGPGQAAGELPTIDPEALRYNRPGSPAKSFNFQTISLLWPAGASFSRSRTNVSMPASPSTLPSRSPTAPGSRGGASGLGSRTSGSATKSTVSRLARPRTPVRTPTSGARRAGASGAAESPGSKAEAEEQQPSGPAVELEALARKNGVLVERLHTLREVRASELSAEELRGVVALVDASASLERLSIMCAHAHATPSPRGGVTRRAF